MPRVKRGVIHAKKRRTLRAKTKGYMWGRKNLIKQAKEAVVKAGVHAYADRKKKKRLNRGLWQIRISAFAKQNDLSYSRLIHGLKANNIELDRKILADLSANNNKIMARIMESVKAEALK
jgi:large subunit ribosomal protein L20